MKILFLTLLIWAPLSYAGFSKTIPENEEERRIICTQIRSETTRLNAELSSAQANQYNDYLSQKHARAMIRVIPEQLAEMEQHAANIGCKKAFTENSVRGMTFDACFEKCKKLTGRNNAQCFDLCNK